MNIYLIIILIALIGEFILRSIVRYLNLRALDTKLPDEFNGFYDAEKYSKSQEYTRAQTKFDYVLSTFNIILILAFIVLGGFNYIDTFVRGFNLYPILTGLMFFGILYFAQDIISIPFSVYDNFVIEEKFGFNKMTLKTFVLDKIKSYFLIIVLGSILLGGILFFFEKAGAYAWLYAWALVSFFIVIAQPIYTLLIAPMFNKFTPLEDDELKESIEDYAQKVKFPLKEICMMDGSKRSAHSNAYFSGFGKKRIALFDTLIEKHSISELVAVIAHEVGHYKKRHIIKGMFISIIHTGILFYFLSLFINSKGLFDAFKMANISVYAGLVFFALLYSPIELILSVLMNYLSRKYEYEADAFAAETTESVDAMILGLKNLYVSNLGNLTPHPLNVVLNYSHPPVLERIRALQKRNGLNN
ncbi:M48 family metallopeptidase [bacterium]|nr:M48 family metallopeptidase [bacterium]